MMIDPATIRKMNPCADRWAAYRAWKVDDTPHPLADVLDHDGGLRDALWVLGRLPGDRPRRIVLAFAVQCAERVVPVWVARYPEDQRPRLAAATARAVLDGGGACAAAYAVAVAAQAAWTAFAADYDAAYAAACAAADDERTAQVACLRALLSGEVTP